MHHPQIEVAIGIVVEERRRARPIVGRIEDRSCTLSKSCGRGCIRESAVAVVEEELVRSAEITDVNVLPAVVVHDADGNAMVKTFPREPGSPENLLEPPVVPLAKEP